MSFYECSASLWVLVRLSVLLWVCRQLALRVSLCELFESLRVFDELQCGYARISVLRCARSHAAALLTLWVLMCMKAFCEFLSELLARAWRCQKTGASGKVWENKCSAFLWVSQWVARSRLASFKSFQLSLRYQLLRASQRSSQKAKSKAKEAMMSFQLWERSTKTCRHGLSFQKLSTFTKTCRHSLAFKSFQLSYFFLRV